MIQCPICGASAVLREYDFGRCPDTGYCDAGVDLDCPVCGVLDVADVDSALAAQVQVSA